MEEQCTTTAAHSGPDHPRQITPPLTLAPLCCIYSPPPGARLQGSQYDPAKEAEKRYMEKMQAKAAAAAAQKADKPE